MIKQESLLFPESASSPAADQLEAAEADDSSRNAAYSSKIDESPEAFPSRETVRQETLALVTSVHAEIQGLKAARDAEGSGELSGESYHRWDNAVWHRLMEHKQSSPSLVGSQQGSKARDWMLDEAISLLHQGECPQECEKLIEVLLQDAQMHDKDALFEAVINLFWIPDSDTSGYGRLALSKGRDWALIKVPGFLQLEGYVRQPVDGMPYLPLLAGERFAGTMVQGKNRTRSVYSVSISFEEGVTLAPIEMETWGDRAYDITGTVENPVPHVSLAGTRKAAAASRWQPSEGEESNSSPFALALQKAKEKRDGS